MGRKSLQGETQAAVITSGILSVQSEKFPRANTCVCLWHRRWHVWKCYGAFCPIYVCVCVHISCEWEKWRDCGMRLCLLHCFLPLCSECWCVTLQHWPTYPANLSFLLPSFASVLLPSPLSCCICLLILIFLAPSSVPFRWLSSTHFIRSSVFPLSHASSSSLFLLSYASSF